jgi:hypothetical protein
MNGDPIGHHYRVTHIDGFYMLPNVPVWSDESLTGKSLYISHGLGYGDQLLFFALIPLIAKHCGHISLSVDSHLVNLVTPSLPNVRIISSDRPLTPTPAPQWLVDTFAGVLPDLQMSMLHLPLLYAQLYPQQPLELLPFLKTPDVPENKFPEEIAFLRNHNMRRKLIGLAWSRGQQFIPDLVGGEGAGHAARTSVTTDAIVNFLNDPELNEFAHFVALHPANEPRSWPDPFPTNLSVPTIRAGCYEEAAQWMTGLDLILTVDMVCATLAALLDCPTWLMISYEGEWLWGQSGDRSVWVPNARIFRQPKLGD